jgi:PEP-CTERM motif
MVRKLLAVALLSLGVVGTAQALETTWTLNLAAPGPLSLLATTTDSNPISTFEVVGWSPVDDMVLPTFYSLTFNGLSAGSYTVRLVTVDATAISIGATTTGNVAVPLSAVPEPEVYGLALAGVSVVGLLAARRRRAAAQV